MCPEDLEVSDRARQWAARVEQRGERDDPVQRDRPLARLERDDPTEGCRYPQRAAGVRAERAQTLEARERRGGATTRASRRPVRVQRVPALRRDDAERELV